MRYYIEIIKHDGEIVAGEVRVAKPLKNETLIKKVQEFAIDNNICPSWAISHCGWKADNSTVRRQRV